MGKNNTLKRKFVISIGDDLARFLFVIYLLLSRKLCI